MRVKRLRRIVPVLLLVAPLSACGGGGGADTAVPSCADVWKVGQVVADGYETCVPGEGETPFPTTECDSGTGPWAGLEYQDGSELYAMIGQKVIADDDPHFDEFYQGCFSD